MKLAVINFSGNVGKTTIARHLLMPRLDGASLVAIESLNADEGQGQALRGRDFGALQEFLQTTDSVVVDIGASNVEELLLLMHRYRGSHEDFDYFIVPTVSALKQQQDTMATLVELARLGVPAHRIRLIFNMVQEEASFDEAFEPLVAFLKERPVATVDPDCRLGYNEVYALMRGSAADLATVAADTTDHKARIVAAATMQEKLRWAEQLAVHRLAVGVVPELDACFSALGLQPPAAADSPDRAA